jgi:hypothetical protein
MQYLQSAPLARFRVLDAKPPIAIVVVTFPGQQTIVFDVDAPSRLCSFIMSTTWFRMAVMIWGKWDYGRWNKLLVGRLSQWENKI